MFLLCYELRKQNKVKDDDESKQNTNFFQLELANNLIKTEKSKS